MGSIDRAVAAGAGCCSVVLSAIPHPHPMQLQQLSRLDADSNPTNPIHR